MREVGIALGVPTGSISMYFYRNTQKPYKGRYLLQKIADPQKFSPSLLYNPPLLTAGGKKGDLVTVKDQRVYGS